MTFFYKSGSPEGTCSDWAIYRSGDLLLPFDYLYISGFHLSYAFWDYVDNRYVNETLSCENQNGVNKLLSALTTDTFQEDYCGTNHLWRVINCQGNTILCVDCDVSVCDGESAWSPICPGQDPMGRDKNLYPLVVNPCGSCYEHKEVYSSLAVSISVATLYPEIVNNSINSTTTLNTVELSMNLTKPGNVYCNAFSPGYVVKSVPEVTSGGFYTSTESSGVHTVTIRNLVPDEEYTTYCYTEDYQNHLMDLEDVVATQLNVSTTCCKSVLFGSFVSTRFNDSVDSYSYSIDSIPSQDTVFEVTLEATTPCDQTEGDILPVAAAYQEYHHLH